MLCIILNSPRRKLFAFLLHFHNRFNRFPFAISCYHRMTLSCDQKIISRIKMQKIFHVANWWKLWEEKNSRRIPDTVILYVNFALKTPRWIFVFAQSCINSTFIAVKQHWGFTQKKSIASWCGRESMVAKVW